MITRPAAVYSLCLLTLLAAVAWTTAGRVGARRTRDTAFAEETACRVLVEGIRRLRESAPVEPAELSDTEIASVLERAVKANAIAPDHLVRVWPAPPRKVKSQPYVEHLTDFTVQGISLRQAVLLLVSVRDARPSFSIQGLRLAARPEREGGWTLEATVSCRTRSSNNATRSTGTRSAGTLRP